MAATVGVALSYGCGHVCARYAFSHGVTVVTAATCRCMLVTLVLAAFLTLRRVPLWPFPRVYPGAALLGLLMATQTVSIQKSVSMMPVAVALLTMYTYPFFTGIVSAWLGQSRFTSTLGIALVAAFAGLILVLDIGGKTFDPVGILLALAASVAFTCILIITPRVTPGLASPLRSFYALLTASIVLGTFAVVAGGFAWPEDPRGLLGLAGLSIFYGFAVVGMFALMARLEAVRFAVVMNLEPVFVAVLAWAALGEALAPLQALGAALVIGAVFFYQLRGQRG